MARHHHVFFWGFTVLWRNSDFRWLWAGQTASQLGEQTCLVVLNFADTAQTVIFDLPHRQPHLLFSSRARADHPLALEWLTLAPFEILIAELT